MSLSRNPIDPRHEEIKFSLKLRGISLADVARELGVSSALVSGALLGRFRSRRVEKAVAAHLCSKPEQLWPDRDHTLGRCELPNH